MLTVMSSRIVWTLGLLIATVAGAEQTARFRVEGVTSTPSTVVATIEPRLGAPGYRWLRVYFYSSLSATERAQVERGGSAASRSHWAAALQFSLDTQSTIWQVDLAVPGHTCTIAASDVDAKKAVQVFQLENGRLSLTAKGVHVCDMKSLGIPNQTFEWDVNVATPVVEHR
jgi:hypothetical protein